MPTCIAPTQSGLPCTRPAMHGSEVCFAHKSFDPSQLQTAGQQETAVDACLNSALANAYMETGTPAGKGATNVRSVSSDEETKQLLQQVLAEQRMTTQAMQAMSAQMTAVVQQLGMLDSRVAAVESGMASFGGQLGSHDEKLRYLYAEIEKLKKQTQNGMQAMEQAQKVNAEVEQKMAQLANRQAEASKLAVPPRMTADGRDIMCCFKLVMPSADLFAGGEVNSKRQLASKVESVLSQHLHPQGGSELHVDVCDVRLLTRKGQQRNEPQSAAAGSPAVSFQVKDRLQAEDIRRLRGQLKGKNICVFDELTPDEYARFKALKPQFDAAKKDRKEAYFRRARLFINKVEVTVV